LLYVGCELLQIKQIFPLALAGVFQGILFLFLLAADFLSSTAYRLSNKIARNPKTFVTRWAMPGYDYFTYHSIQWALPFITKLTFL